MILGFLSPSFTLTPPLLFFPLSPKTNDCYVRDWYYLRPLKKSGTSKHSYYLRFRFSSSNSYYIFHYYYHYNNPLRVVYFHINHWALADRIKDDCTRSQKLIIIINKNICRF
jgi:hypothetical protein